MRTHKFELKFCVKTILREKSLAIYFEGSQFRRNMTFNFIVSKYMLTNVHEYVYINMLTFHIM